LELTSTLKWQFFKYKKSMGKMIFLWKLTRESKVRKMTFSSNWITSVWGLWWNFFNGWLNLFRLRLFDRVDYSAKRFQDPTGPFILESIKFKERERKIMKKVVENKRILYKFNFAFLVYLIHLTTFQLFGLRLRIIILFDIIF
jgi:hypothetical protein